MAEHLANHDEPPDRDDGWQDLAVANPTFLLERLGSECGDLQFLRELTVNGLDAIAAQLGRVVWDLDWQRLEASAGKVRKLTVTDTGTGMRPDQLGRHINQLASSSREQSHTANFGVGAKVAAGSRNPHGLEYRSWHQGQGSLVCFKRHPDGRWGLEPQRWPDGRTDFWRPLGEQDKPWLLRGQDHGTQVVLLGHHERDDTTRAPQSVSDTRRHWIPRYLNSRFRQFPDGIEVLVRDHHDRGKPGQLTRVEGERPHVERRAVCGGIVEISDAVACWWVLDEDHRARRREAGAWTSSGHIVTVHGDELYDLLAQTRGGYGRLQDFGVRFGYERVVIHLQPQLEPHRLQANTARTTLLLDHEPLPWTRWGDEFAAAMPDEIRQLQEHAANADCVPRRKRSADASPRSCRSTDSADTGQPNRHGNHPPSRRASAPAMSPPAIRRPGPKRTAPRRPQNRRTPLRTETRPTTGRTVSRPPTTPIPIPMPSPALSISPTSPGSPPATAPEHRVTSRTRPPDTTPAATSSRSTPTSDAPRGALLYPRCSREELEGMFLGPMALPGSAR